MLVENGLGTATASILPFMKRGSLLDFVTLVKVIGDIGFKPGAQVLLRKTESGSGCHV